MARNDGIDRTSARNVNLTAAKIGNAQRHNEREKESYTNPDIIPERTSQNIHFKKPTAGYAEMFAQMEEEMKNIPPGCDGLMAIGLGIREPLLKYRLSNQGKSGNKLQSARMTFMVYRYLGFGILKSCYYFASYALHGVWKYYGFSGKEHKKTTENQRR